MIMRREQGAAFIGIMQVFDRRPGNREAIISRGATTNLIQNDKGLWCCLGQDGGRFDHFDHEGRASAGQIIAGANAREDAIR